MPTIDLRCWCGADATYADAVDPAVSNDATGVFTHDGEPAALRCADHSTGGWHLADASIAPTSTFAWWKPTIAILVDAR
jgi:hypothetical protein